MVWLLRMVNCLGFLIMLFCLNGLLNINLCFEVLLNMVIGELEVEWFGFDILGESFFE